LPILVGSSVDLVVGQNVLAIGNPFGLDQSLTTGVISGLGREIETEESSTRSSRPIQDVIQTDAAINPGNSGGPLLDSAGRLIGVNTSIVSPSGVYAGVGFAIPVDVVNDVVTQIIRHGKFMRPGFGVKVLTDAYAREWGIQGVLVTEVMPLSSAAEAGLRATVFRGGAPVDYGDIIIGLDGEKVESERDLYKMLDRRKVGDWVTLRVHRASGDEDVRIRLQGISPEG
jgi:S1-C subfamily serine protease